MCCCLALFSVPDPGPGPPNSSSGPCGGAAAAAVLLLLQSSNAFNVTAAVMPTYTGAALHCISPLFLRHHLADLAFIFYAQPLAWSSFLTQLSPPPTFALHFYITIRLCCRKLLPSIAHHFQHLSLSHKLHTHTLTQHTNSSRCLSLAATLSRSSLPSSSHLLVSSWSEVAARKYSHINTRFSFSLFLSLSLSLSLSPTLCNDCAVADSLPHSPIFAIIRLAMQQ